MTLDLNTVRAVKDGEDGAVDAPRGRCASYASGYRSSRSGTARTITGSASRGAVVFSGRPTIWRDSSIAGWAATVTLSGTRVRNGRRSGIVAASSGRSIAVAGRWPSLNYRCAAICPGHCRFTAYPSSETVAAIWSATAAFTGGAIPVSTGRLTRQTLATRYTASDGGVGRASTRGPNPAFPIIDLIPAATRSTGVGQALPEGKQGCLNRVIAPGPAADRHLGRRGRFSMSASQDEMNE